MEAARYGGQDRISRDALFQRDDESFSAGRRDSADCHHAAWACGGLPRIGL